MSVRVVVLLLLLPFELTAQKWLREFRPDPRCALVTSLGGAPVPEAKSGALFVRPIDIISRQPLGTSRVIVWTASDTSGRDLPAVNQGPFSTVGALLREVPTGRMRMRTLSIGYDPRRDTIEVRPGVVDTVEVPMIANLSFDIRCSTPRFRRDGESACAPSSGGETDHTLSWARGFARDSVYGRMGIAGFTESEVELVRDERTCRRAAEAYGGSKDPPRIVIVIRLGKLGHLVFDPYEPERAGEFSINKIFDRRWRFIIGIAA